MKNIIYRRGIITPFFCIFLPFIFMFFMLSTPAALQGAIDDGLVAYWPLDEGSGTIANDVTGHGHDGTATGGISWVSGKLGGAFNTNDSGYFTIPQDAALRPVNAVSVQCWAKINGFTTWDSLVSNCWDTGSTEAGYEIHEQDGTGFRCELSGSFRAAHAANPALGQWVHIVGTYDGTTVKTYFNGVLVASNNTASGPIDWDPVPYALYIGRFHDDNENYVANAIIDEVAIWNRALTQEEIDYLYNDGNGNPATGGVYVTIVESDGSTRVTEGQPGDSYTVALLSQPTENVVITATPSDGRVDIGNGPGQAISLTFTPGNFQTPQTITVTAVDDNIYEGKAPHTTTITHTAQGGNYTGTDIKSVKVMVMDNDKTCGDWGYLPADFNRDCYVDLLDFSLLAKQWLQSLP